MFLFNWWLGRKLLTRIHEFIAHHSLVVRSINPKIMAKTYLPKIDDWGLNWQNYDVKMVNHLPEEFYLPCYQGIKLNCWIYRQTSDHFSQRWVVFLHDWGENIFQVLPYADLYYRHGYNVLLYDAREHGLNAGDELVFSFGYFDKFDLIKILLWLNHKFKPATVALHGRGIGGTTVLEAWKILPQLLQTLVEGIVVENPWMWPLKTLASWPQRQGSKFGSRCYRYGLKWAIKKQDHYSIIDVRPGVNTTRRITKKPLLVLVDKSSCNYNKKLNFVGTKQFWQRQRQRQHWQKVTHHALSYDSKRNVPVDRIDYQTQILKFFHI